MNKPAISVIIPTFNRCARLKRVLESLEAQTLPLDQFEVIVVSDGSTDGTNDFLRSLACRPLDGNGLQIHPLYQENQGVAVARNEGFRHAASDLVLFLDDDVIPSPTLVEKHAAYQPRDAVLMGPMLTPDDAVLKPWVLWEQRMLEKQYEAMAQGKWEATARQFFTGNTSLYKKYLEQAGGFDPSFRRAEDVELSYRLEHLGCKFVFDPGLKAYHYADRSFKSWNNSAYSYGRNDVIMTFTKGQDWLLPTVFHEFYTRNWMIRLIVKFCLGRPLLVKIFTFLLNVLAKIGTSLHMENIFRAAYSGIFNLHYYQGVADELGSGKKFREMLERFKTQSGSAG